MSTFKKIYIGTVRACIRISLFLAMEYFMAKVICEWLFGQDV